MARSNLAVVEEELERPTEVAPGSGTEVRRPFSLRYWEKVGPKPVVRKPGVPDVFDDPTTVDQTGEYEDPHTDPA